VAVSTERQLIPVACTLEPSEMPDRLAQWQVVVAQSTSRARIDGGLGVRLDLPAGTDVAGLAQLVAAEQTCCAFFAFAITVDHRGLGLEVRAPADAVAALDGLLGPDSAAY
jgi:hypothetical protein